MQNNQIDQLLAQAAAHPPQASSALIDRVLADAFALQPALDARPEPRARAEPGLLARLARRFGGAPALAAVSAAVLGLAVGYLNPTSLDSLAGGLISSGTEEFFPAVDFLGAEG